MNKHFILFLKDYKQYGRETDSVFMKIYNIHHIPGLNYMFWLRCTAAFSEKKTLKILFILVGKRLKKLSYKYGIDIPFNTKIEGGMLIRHFGGIIINNKVIIGENLAIGAGTVIGKKNGGIPVIGNNVTIGVNSVLIGDITVGNNTIIGAGSVVVHDVPDNAVVAGNPARILRINE